MFLKITIIFVVLVNVNSIDVNSDENYVDAVINMLLNGDSVEFEHSDEDLNGQEPVLTGGVWKCGNCNDIDESKLVYTEVNDVDAAMADDSTMDIQIGLTVQDMQCITVIADVAGIVRRVSGTCNGTSVTLNVAPAQHYTVRVYS